MACRRNGPRNFIYLLLKIDYGMLQPKDNNEYQTSFYEHQPSEILIIDEVTNITIEDFFKKLDYNILRTSCKIEFRK